MANADMVMTQMRMILGDQSSSFEVSVEAPGDETRFETGTYPIDGSTLKITVDGVPENNAVVEERTGVVTFDTAPAEGNVINFQGTKWRYFGTADLTSFLSAAEAEQFHNRTDAQGNQLTVDTMPLVEAYPLAINATIKALWALAIDASFDIDIYAPDGVHIPRSERYRQLMELIDALTGQYKQYEAQLNIGLDRIEVFTTRRVSRTTGRYVPLYVEREVDDRNPPTRIYTTKNTYGADPTVIQQQLAADIAKISTYMGPLMATMTNTGTVAATPINENGGYLTVDGTTQVLPAPGE